MFRPDRRLVAVSAVNIHGGLLRDIERKRDVWILDPRVPAHQQIDNTVYDANNFDRGHLTRRHDPGWGTVEEANAPMTQRSTTPTPQLQASGFNQSKELWAGLEDYILGSTSQYPAAPTTGPTGIDVAKRDGAS